MREKSKNNLKLSGNRKRDLKPLKQNSVIFLKIRGKKVNFFKAPTHFLILRSTHSLLYIIYLLHIVIIIYILSVDNKSNKKYSIWR